MIFKKGFTLIELLVVIAVIAVLATALITAINPVERINAANDAKAQSDVNQIVTGMGSYAAANDGLYPANAAALIDTTTGTMKNIPVAPNNYTYTITYSTTAPTIWATVKSKKLLGANASGYWVWCASNGKVGFSASQACMP